MGCVFEDGWSVCVLVFDIEFFDGDFVFCWNCVCDFFENGLEGFDEV